MKEPSESSGSDSYHLLAKSDMLYWKSNGTTNLIKWMPMFLQAVKGKFFVLSELLQSPFTDTPFMKKILISVFHIFFMYHSQKVS